MKTILSKTSELMCDISDVFKMAVHFYKETTGWDGLNARQKWYIVWFIVSVPSVFILAGSWLIVPALANLALASNAAIKNVDIPDFGEEKIKEDHE